MLSDIIKLSILSVCLCSCNSGGGEVAQNTADYSLVAASIPQYGQCKNEKLCVTQINPKTKNYGNNTLVYIPVGQFGLVGYTFKNQTKYDMSPVEISKDSFPTKEFGQDVYRSTCINNELSPAEECNIVVKYQPIYYNQSGYVKLKFNSEQYSTPTIIEPYSARNK